MFALTVDTMTA